MLGQIGLMENGSLTLPSGYFASYYSRAIWPLLCIEYFPEQREKATESLDLLWENTNNYYSFKDWGFNPSKPGLSHTIAYTIEGFIESGVVLNRQEMINYCLNSLEVLCKVIKKMVASLQSIIQDGKPVRFRNVSQVKHK